MCLSRRCGLRLLVIVGMFGSLVLAAYPTRAAESPVEVVADHLDNPRGITVSGTGTIYVAEAGRGGDAPCIQGPEGDAVCYGQSGAITRIQDGIQQRIAEGLPSLAAEGGNFATGPHDVAFLGKGTLYATIGLGANPAARDQFGAAGKDFGQLVYLRANGLRFNVEDIAGYEATANPDQGEPESNPYGLLSQLGQRIVVDAGGNSLLQVSSLHGVSTLAVFPDRLVDAPPFLGLPPGSQIPMQAVPTSVAAGPDGSYVVGQLTGFPFPVGGARVYKVTPGSTTPEVYAEGFTNIIDVAYHDGNLYVLELVSNGLLQAEQPGGDPSGALIRVAPDGTRTTLVSEGLVFPGGMAFGPDGAIYITNNSVFAGQGQVVRITP